VNLESYFASVYLSNLLSKYLSEKGLRPPSFSFNFQGSGEGFGLARTNIVWNSKNYRRKKNKRLNKKEGGKTI
jgi:hypothetical protein